MLTHSFSFCTKFHPIKPGRSLDSNNILGFNEPSFIKLWAITFTCARRFYVCPTGKWKLGKLCVKWLCLIVSPERVILGGGSDVSWDHARPSHGAAGVHVPGTPASSVCFSPLRVWVERGGFSFQRRQNLMRGGGGRLSKGREEWEEPWGSRDPKTVWCHCLWLFPSSCFCLGWEKEKISSLAAVLRTLPECLLLIVSYNTFCFLWKVFGQW